MCLKVTITTKENINGKITVYRFFSFSEEDFFYFMHQEWQVGLTIQEAFFPRGSGPRSFGFLQSGLKNIDINMITVVDLGNGFLVNIIHQILEHQLMKNFNFLSQQWKIVEMRGGGSDELVQSFCQEINLCKWWVTWTEAKKSKLSQ